MIRVFIGPPLFSPVKDRGPVDFPLSGFNATLAGRGQQTCQLKWISEHRDTIFCHMSPLLCCTNNLIDMKD